ncbi:MAG: TIGR03118 family protein [Hyphomicrobiales bacterium]
MRTPSGLGLAMVLVSMVFPASSGASAAPRFEVVPLVSDQAGVAAHRDPDLVNAWGVAHAPGGPNWVADNGTDKSTVYDRTTGMKGAPTIRIPHGAPTGVAFVPPGAGFEITINGYRAPATFLFDTESGAIEAWNYFASNKAVIVVDNSAKGSVYKGLALDPKDKLLFAADFANGRVDVFNSRFRRILTFTDPGLPSRYAPFNVAWLDGKLYVAFAKREKGGTDEVAGKGFGFVDAFDAQGTLLKNLVSRGRLNAPWGMTLAPKGFGQFEGALLVGNFGDGLIHAYDASSGDALGAVRGKDGSPIAIDGLWALDAGPNSNVTFTAGPDDETHGLLGLVSPAGAAKPTS